MRKCRHCEAPIDDAATTCPHCSRDLIPGRTAPPAASGVAPAPATGDDAYLMRVSVVDISMPFGSMVGFMVKWSIAAIPAMLILGGLMAFLVYVVGGLLAGLLRS